MMKFLKNKYYIVAFVTLLLVVGSLIDLFYDAFYDTNFRSVQDEVHTHETLDLKGLRELNASGGTSASLSAVERRLIHVPGPKILVDGIKQFHGYINGIPTTLLGYHNIREPSFRHILRRLIMTGSVKIRPELVNTEEEEAKKYGFGYQRVDIVGKSYPTDQDVDRVVSFFESLPENVWLHFHCHHGKGRTTILLVMLDTLKNAPNVSLENIVKRHHALGSINLFNTDKWKHGTYTNQQLERRKKFVEDFYAFIVQRKQGGFNRWIDWKNSKISNVEPR